MAHRLTSVFAGLRAGLHALVAGLLALVVVRVLLEPVGDRPRWAELVLCAAFAAAYALGARVARAAPARRAAAGAAWVAALTGLWAALVVVVPVAAYLVFPLFFLYLHVLPGRTGPAAVVVTTAVTVAAIGLHDGFTPGGVVGPVVGAVVALLIGGGYRALARESAAREELLAELLATRDRLAAAEREQGVLAERARLAREIHDTVAQGLSSIQLLLHAAELADADRPGTEHIRLARTTAAEGLADTRRLIRDLVPPALDQGVVAALGRLGEQWGRDGLAVVVEAPDGEPDVPMDVATAVLRIAQGAVANAAQHAGASRVVVGLGAAGPDVLLEVVDDGAGFDPVAVAGRAAATDSFGLRAMAERVAQLDGELVVDSAPGRGTTVRVRVAVPGAVGAGR
ncbi:sensor histidine kinase [Klenkia sp. PcliD-1-E]|uniref:sensor histidine kinase n=1 Tax=Klenkia sp. PcliD-1-E TaxID=2954492 RepID=UPI002097F068|nr:sensor histidine kinase [Klenkia sp. PcliD-1-E]MCO7221321.1 sensor histidine kinase [Klenkia sp. PcliD-1-E]